jgi:hypothetical protein
MRDLDAERMIGSPWNHFPKEDDLALVLLYLDPRIPNAVVARGELVELVVMRREERSCRDIGPLMQIFDQRPGDRQAVERARPPAHFVEEDERLRRGIV